MSTDTPARQEVARGQVILESRCVPFRVVRSRRARSLRLRMLGDGVVEIVVSTRMPIPSIEELLASYQRWIFRQLDRHDALPAGPTDCVYYLGREYRVVVSRGSEGPGAALLLEQDLHVALPASEEVGPVIESFFRQQARLILMDRVATWADVIGVRSGPISIRDQRTRWGSCSSSGRLSFSWRLAMAPPAVLDYVVIHELMHLREMNHGPQFWSGVAQYCPGYQQHRAWLKEHGVRLARPFRVGG